MIARNYGSASCGNNPFQASADVRFTVRRRDYVIEDLKVTAWIWVQDHWLFDHNNQLLDPQARICERAVMGSLIFKKVTEEQASVSGRKSMWSLMSQQVASLNSMNLSYNGEQVRVEAPSAKGRKIIIHMVNGSYTMLVATDDMTCLKVILAFGACCVVVHNGPVGCYKHESPT